MQKREFTYPSRDGETRIHAVSWLPEGKPAAVLQIVHGMCEYIDRYDGFARFLAANGIAVTGHDHLGHGASVTSPDRLGYFAAENGNLTVLKDIHALRRITRKQFPDVPYFLLGHSMGSFLTRQYIARCGEGLQAVIIMGTGSQPEAVLQTGMSLCSAIAAARGWDYRSTLVNGMSLGAYNKHFRPARTPSDWISKDTAVVDAYVADPLCSFCFTLNGYYNLFRSISDAQDAQTVAMIPKSLPLLLVSGADDPVGDFGSGVRRAFRSYQEAGIQDLRLKLYPNDRHEILNETDRETVYDDLLGYLRLYLP